jgi:hypothetical protein
LSRGRRGRLRVKPYQLEDVRRVGQALDKRRLLLENRAYRESLEDRVREQARENEELFLASIQSLAEALGAQGSVHARTSIRVSKYSSAIAGAMGLHGDMLRQIELGGRSRHRKDRRA